MKEYKNIIQFNFKNETFNMYVDNKNKHFFLKVNTNGLSYVSLQELFELTEIFVKTPLVMRMENKQRNKLKFIPKVLLGGTSTVLTLAIAIAGLSVFNNQKDSKKEFLPYPSKDFSNSSTNSNIDKEELNNYISFADDYKNKRSLEEELVVDTFLESERLKFLFIYDMEYLDKVFDYKNVSLDQLKQVVKNNSGISKRFKDLIYEYCESVVKKYPDIELRVFYENLKTLEIVECTERELMKASISIGTSGVYNRNENKIYVLKDYQFLPKTWDYQVMYHELSHCLRTGSWNKNGTKIKVQVEGQNFSNVITAEALNSLFSVSLFDYEEKDIAYQLQSNYHKIIIDCLDNYTLSDYVDHSVSYYAKKLDEYNKDENYSTTILELIQFQYKDFHNTAIKVRPEEYYPIYDYISNMYFKKHIKENMTHQEALNLTDILVSDILYDVPEDYNIDTERFYSNLEEYCKEIGISFSKSK